jgi:cell division protein ZapA (FtsZ GTPase activity inhibitor)
VEKYTINNTEDKMEVLKIRHILDNILSYLRGGWFAEDYLNLLLALNLTDEYAHRELKLNNPNFQHITRALLDHNLKNFSLETIRSNFTLFWQSIDLDKFNEEFFIISRKI